MLKEVIKARIRELQSDIDQVKVELTDLKSAGLSPESMQKLDELTRKLLTLKAGQAELINLLQIEV